LALMPGTTGAETVANLEAVDINGVSIWTGPFPIILTGVILNDPSEMLDSTPDFLPWDDGTNAYDLLISQQHRLHFSHQKRTGLRGG